VGGRVAPVGGLGDAVCACGMVGAGVNDFGTYRFAKSRNATVIGCDDEFVQFSTKGSTFEDVLKEWLPK
jgi:hypothetical protein